MGSYMRWLFEILHFPSCLAKWMEITWGQWSHQESFGPKPEAQRGLTPFWEESLPSHPLIGPDKSRHLVLGHCTPILMNWTFPAKTYPASCPSAALHQDASWVMTGESCPSKSASVHVTDSQNHRIVESSVLEGTHRITDSNASVNGQYRVQTHNFGVISTLKRHSVSTDQLLTSLGLWHSH